MDYLGYSSILEWVAEKSQSNPNFIRQLNPGLDWDRFGEGAIIKVPRMPI